MTGKKFIYLILLIIYSIVRGIRAKENVEIK